MHKEESLVQVSCWTCVKRHIIERNDILRMKSHATKIEKKSHTIKIKIKIKYHNIT